MMRPAYVPILPVESSQLAGLAATSEAVKASLTPLFDVLTLGPELADGGGGPARALTRRLDAIAAAWGDRRAYLDCRTGRGDERLIDGRVHLAHLFDEERERKLKLVPVTGLQRPMPYQLAVADAASDRDRGACLRLELADLRDPAHIDVAVQSFLVSHRFSPELLDLLVDLGEIGQTRPALLEVTARAVLAPLWRLAPWRSVTLAASAPPPLVEGPSVTAARTEWMLWRMIAESSPLGHRLRFGDHAAYVPERADWAAAATTRHLTVVVEQLAAL
jgi:hypothetical protein